MKKGELRQPDWLTFLGLMLILWMWFGIGLGLAGLYLKN